MKYVVVLGDGMADEALEELDGCTPLEAAHKPGMDSMAAKGEMGMVKTVPENMSPASDVANLSVMGYDPNKYYSGRSPLEAVSMGITMKDTDVAVRCNLVTLSKEEKYADKTMLDYSSDEITTAEAAELMWALQKQIGTEVFKFYPGISYRHCMIWANGSVGLSLTPPHDITGRKIADKLPENKDFLDMMEKSYAVLKDHPVNLARIAKGLNPANSIWLWGEGTKPSLPLFKEKYGLRGAMISAVDLLKGIAMCAGLESIDVPGATGNIHTDFSAKKNAAVRALRDGHDFVYIHIEAPDECGHRHEIDNKVRSIELIDKKVLTPLIEELKEFGGYKIMLLPDHPTPLALRTHTRNPVPFVIYSSADERDNAGALYTEAEAEKTGLFVPEGYTLMDRFLKG